VVRRGYDPEEVDAYFSQLAARLLRRSTSTPPRNCTGRVQDEVTSLQRRAPSFEQVGGEAAALLQEPVRPAEQIRAEVAPSERRWCMRPTGARVPRWPVGRPQRVHGEISGLLERTRKQRDEALGAGGATDPKATQNGKPRSQPSPTKAAEGE
jgi:hypothetical protein